MVAMNAEQIARFRTLIAQWRTAGADPYSEEQAQSEGEILDQCALELETALNLTVAEQQRGS